MFNQIQVEIMKTLFERLSKENQEKILEHELSTYYLTEKKDLPIHPNELPFAIATTIWYQITGQIKVDPLDFYNLFKDED